MSGFSQPIDIVNRGLQKIGAGKITSLTATDSIQAVAANDCYDKLRRVELRRNNWVFAIKRAALRPVGAFNATKFPAFALWLVGTTYAQNDIIKGSDGQIYFSLGTANVGNDPTLTTGFWSPYFGPLTLSEFVTTWGAGFTYAVGDHSVGSDSQIYVSLVAGNINHNPVGDGNVHWEVATSFNAADTTQAATTSTLSFYAGELVFIGATVYLSLQSSNTDTPPSTKWLALTAPPTLTVPNYIYPLGAGPVQQSFSRNIFKLPNNYMRSAPQSTKAGSSTVMGAPTNLAYTDWEYKSGYLTSRLSTAIPLRFIADMTDVTLMDDMFCEGLACRVAFELCEPLTQSVSKLGSIGKEYQQWMGEARTVNGIEIGPVESPLDDFLQVRI